MRQLIKVPSSPARDKWLTSFRIITCVFFAVTIVMFSRQTLASKIVKWVDENGKVHFGDKAPANMIKNAEEIAIEHAPVNVPEKETQRKNSQFWHQQEQAAEQAKKQKKRDQHYRKKQKEKQVKTPSIEEQVMACRDKHTANVRRRTECFNRIKR